MMARLNSSGRVCALSAAIAAALLTLAPAWAQELPDFGAGVDEARARLNLTDGQVEQLTPIFEAYFDAQMAILEEHGIDAGAGAGTGGGGQRSNIGNLRGLQRALRENGAEFEAQLATVLSGEQMAEFRALREEGEEHVREAVMAGRMEQIGRQIGLDEAQLEQFQPIYAGHVENQMAILDEHGIEIGGGRQGRTRLRTLLALRRDLQAAEEATLQRLSAVLSDEQLAAYRAIQDEQRERNRELIQ